MAPQAVETAASDEDEADSATEKEALFDVMVKVGAAVAIVSAGVYLLMKYNR
jgi:flagellar biogenesis protein FliO